MENPITKYNICVTPLSEAHLTQLVESMSNRAEAWQVLMFTMNYCHRIVRDELMKEPRKAMNYCHRIVQDELMKEPRKVLAKPAKVLAKPAISRK
jgi:hypothetical protein